MAKTYQQVLEEIKNLQSEAEDLRRQELASAISEAKAIITKFGLTAADLGLGGKAAKKSKGGKGVAKYRHPSDASLTWTGHGRKPRWLEDRLAQGASVEQFLIK